MHTAKRLSALDGLPIVANLLRHSEDVKDPCLPLLCWWALESKCDSDRDAVLKLFADSPLWFEPMVEQHILGRLMRRYAAAGTRKDMLTCAKLFDQSPSPRHTRLLMAGFEDAFAGRALTGLPDELVKSMARHDVGSDALKLRAGDAAALARALVVVADREADRKLREQLIGVLGEVRPVSALEILLRVVEKEFNVNLRKAALAALMGYDDVRIPAMVVKQFNGYAPEVRVAALALLSGRAAWSMALVRAVDSGSIKAPDVPLESVRHMKRHKGEELARLIARHWPRSGVATTEEMQRQIQRLTGVVRGGQGNPYAGQTLFNATCAACHTLFTRGGKVGPDLTAYQRGDLDAMLLHVVNPGAEIREGYENFLIETKDERSLTGFLVERDVRRVVLRTADGQNIAIEQKDIAEMKAAGLSLMPEGLLDAMNDQQVRDIFAYLRSTQPLAN